MISCAGGAKEMASYNAYKNEIEKACKGQRVGGNGRQVTLTDEMIRFNGHVPFSLRKRGKLYCYVVESFAASFPSTFVTVYLRQIVKVN